MHDFTIFIFLKRRGSGIEFFVLEDRFVTAEALVNTGFSILILLICVAAGLNFYAGDVGDVGGRVWPKCPPITHTLFFSAFLRIQ